MPRASTTDARTGTGAGISDSLTGGARPRTGSITGVGSSVDGNAGYGAGRGSRPMTAPVTEEQTTVGQRIVHTSAPLSSDQKAVAAEAGAQSPWFSNVLKRGDDHLRSAQICTLVLQLSFQIM